MNKELMIFRASSFGFVAALLLLPLAGSAAPSKSTNAAPQDIKSIFVMPNSPKDGRDPFFPNATSLYQSAASPVPTARPMPLETLKLVGILGNSLANINGVTFAVGETQEVKTSSGSISVRLLQIKARDESVVIEANGLRRELRAGGGGLSGRP